MMPRLLRLRFAALLLPLLALACSGGEEEKATPAAPPAETPAASAAPAPEENFKTVKARLKVIGMDGAPITGMAPIATRQPNAFDEPVAIGALSNADGLTEFEFPGTEKLYVRAWDPERRYFANNYFDALPNTGNVSGELTIQMAQGGTLAATLLGENGNPLPGTLLKVMLFHPTLGAWWPAQGESDDSGKVLIGPVPAGQYTLKIKAANGEKELELPATLIPPGGLADLGTLSLR